MYKINVSYVICFNVQGPIVRKVDKLIHWINLYPLDKSLSGVWITKFVSVILLNTLSVGQLFNRWIATSKQHLNNREPEELRSFRLDVVAKLLNDCLALFA